MATTTTNFGWDIPQSTDLVKDGATAIAALGQDIDTAFVDFKGGTTGQVLKKTSNTDLDVEWGTASSGLTLINTTSFSGVASQVISGVFSSTYDNYEITFNNLTATGTGWLAMQMRNGGTTETSANYNFQGLTGTNTTVAASKATGQTSWGFMLYLDPATVASAVTLRIQNPFATKPTSGVSARALSSSVAADISMSMINFGLNTNTSYDSFVVSGLTITGSISVYGYNK